MSIKEHPPQHVPVLLGASLELLNPKSGESYLDLTAGYGGHAAKFLAKTNSIEKACLVDRDAMAIESLKRFEDRGARLIHADFVSAAEQLVSEGQVFDNILVDLGVSSPQLDRFERGFSFTNIGPLDMRMDNRQDLTASQYLDTVSESELADTIHRYGEEPIGRARRYAKAIIAARPLTTTKDLADAVARAHHGKWQGIHPATRTFQAIRIVINDELGQIEKLLPLIPQLLSSQGRVGIISFHSLEDRLVKQYFKAQAEAGFEAELEIVTKKPRFGTEDVSNPRARSAKLRVAHKK